ncbi:Nudix family hydrolase [Sinimarinibacterium flocculans]|uniref:Nudix family hydrolase n=1 Tax=Sinimarinibacterium flocculans TaxID=985250 RepID=UPI003516987A
MPSTAPEVPAGASSSRPVIRVAAGVLKRPTGKVLFTQRPEGKIAAGWWEFPGGKIESGEAGFDALTRELEEELGVRVREARPLVRFLHDYSNRTVLLDTWLVTAYDGEPQSREAQALRWVVPAALTAWPQALPTVLPIVRALTLPVEYVFTPPDIGADDIVNGLSRLPAGSLLRLRLPDLDDLHYHRIAETVAPHVAAAGLRLVLDRSASEAAALGAAGWHATATALRRMDALPAVPGLRLASVHDAQDLRRAQDLGFDAAVLGAVLPTASHPGAATLGWGGFAAVRAHAALPVFAIGGVGPAALADAFRAWGQGVAAISAYWPRR